MCEWVAGGGCDKWAGNGECVRLCLAPVISMIMLAQCLSQL